MRFGKPSEGCHRTSLEPFGPCPFLDVLGGPFWDPFYFPLLPFTSPWFPLLPFASLVHTVPPTQLQHCGSPDTGILICKHPYLHLPPVGEIEVVHIEQRIERGVFAECGISNAPAPSLSLSFPPQPPGNFPSLHPLSPPPVPSPAPPDPPLPPFLAKT